MYLLVVDGASAWRVCLCTTVYCLLWWARQVVLEVRSNTDGAPECGNFTKFCTLLWGASEWTIMLHIALCSYLIQIHSLFCFHVEFVLEIFRWKDAIYVCFLSIPNTPTYNICLNFPKTPYDWLRCLYVNRKRHLFAGTELRIGRAFQ